MLLSGQHRPHDAGIVIGQSDRRDIRMASLEQRGQPRITRWFASGQPGAQMTNHRPGAVDQQGSQVLVTPFADPEQSLPSAGRMRAVMFSKYSPGGTSAGNTRRTGIRAC